MNMKNIAILVAVLLVIYFLYTRMENFAEEKKHHMHHPTRHHMQHSTHHMKHPMHHKAVEEVESSKWNRLPNREFAGYDMYTIPGKSIDDCEKICGNDELCTHTTFMNDTCFIKSPNGIAGKYIAGFKRKDNTYARYMHSDLAGFDLQGSGNPEPTLEDCELACNGSPDCYNYTYSVDGKNCYLKGPNATSAPGLVLSLKP